MTKKWLPIRWNNNPEFTSKEERDTKICHTHSYLGFLLYLAVPQLGLRIMTNFVQWVSSDRGNTPLHEELVNLERLHATMSVGLGEDFTVAIKNSLLKGSLLARLKREEESKMAKAWARSGTKLAESADIALINGNNLVQRAILAKLSWEDLLRFASRVGTTGKKGGNSRWQRDEEIRGNKILREAKRSISREDESVSKRSRQESPQTQIPLALPSLTEAQVPVNKKNRTPCKRCNKNHKSKCLFGKEGPLYKDPNDNHETINANRKDFYVKLDNLKTNWSEDEPDRKFNITHKGRVYEVSFMKKRNGYLGLDSWRPISSRVKKANNDKNSKPWLKNVDKKKDAAKTVILANLTDSNEWQRFAPKCMQWQNEWQDCPESEIVENYQDLV
jgi:hypothetical protein